MCVHDGSKEEILQSKRRKSARDLKGKICVICYFLGILPVFSGHLVNDEVRIGKETIARGMEMRIQNILIG